MSKLEYDEQKNHSVRNAAIIFALILIGVFMLLQPFAMWMFTYSFIVILVGTVGFIITSHFPD